MLFIEIIVFINILNYFFIFLIVVKVLVILLFVFVIISLLKCQYLNSYSGPKQHSCHIALAARVLSLIMWYKYETETHTGASLPQYLEF